MHLRFQTALLLALTCHALPASAQPKVPAPNPTGPADASTTAAPGDGKAAKPVAAPAGKKPPGVRRRTPPPPGCTAENLVHYGRISGTGLKGASARIGDNVFAQEGSAWNGRWAVRLEKDKAELRIDLQRVHQLRAFAIQADNNDAYLIEGSIDGKEYELLWSSPIAKKPGLRTRMVKLKKARSVRYLRVKGVGGDGRFSVAELQAFCKVPKPWPLKLRIAPTQIRWKMFTNPMMVSLKAWLALAGLLVLLGMSLPHRGPRLRYRRWLQPPLGVAAVLGLAALAGWGITEGRWFSVPWRYWHGIYMGRAGGVIVALAIPPLLLSVQRQPYRGWLQLPLLLAGLGGIVAWWFTATRGWLIGGGVALAIWFVMRWTNGETELSAGWIQRLTRRITTPRWTNWAYVVLLCPAAVAMFYFIEDNPKLGPRAVPHMGAIICAAGAVMALGALWLLLRWLRAAPSFDRSARMTLAIIGLLSLSAWWNAGHFHFNHFIHIWEQYHYVIGAKYGPELRYTRLYECTAVADNEDKVGKRVRERRMRDLAADNDLIKTTEILAHPERCKDHFTPERWEAFRADIRFFRGRFSRDRWDKSQTDHGYNATAVWSIGARIIAEATGRLTWNKIVYLGSIDFGLLMLMWGVTWWAFGWRATCTALIFWGCNFPARYYWNGGSFLRYDWLLWLVVGICMLKRRHMFLAGTALTYATGLRIFPGFVVAALVLKALARMVRERRFVLSRAHTVFAAGCIATIALLTPASDWAMGGLDSWGEFAVNSDKHLKTALTNNMGLKTALGYDHETRAARTRSKKHLDPFKDWKDARTHFYGKRSPIFFGLIFLFCLILARAGDREEDWVAACLGTGLIAIAAELTCYYYGFLLAYGLMLDRRRIPALAVTALSAATCGLYHLFPWNDQHFAAMSVVTTVMVVGVTAHVAFGRRLPPEIWPPEPATREAPATGPVRREPG